MHDYEADGFSDAPFGPFAGYVRIGAVHSLGASFTVPRITQGSALGEASTWIGVQGQGPPARFVQIGAVEGRIWLARRQKTVDGYFAFWSDTAQHYKAKPLFEVNPGDALSASLVLTGKRWALAIADETSGKEMHLSIAGEARAPFDQAEWTQEDPGSENDHVRYPRIAAPVFRDLTVNSTEPATSSSALYSQWMSVSHSDVAPTVVHDDSFTLQRAPAVGAAGMQYLRLATAMLAGHRSFEVERSSWTSRTPYTQIVSASSKMIEAIRKANSALLSARWSKRIARLVRAVTDASVTLLERVRPPALLTEATFAAWSSALTEASLLAVGVHRNSDRADLGYVYIRRRQFVDGRRATRFGQRAIGRDRKRGDLYRRLVVFRAEGFACQQYFRFASRESNDRVIDASFENRAKLPIWKTDDQILVITDVWCKGHHSSPVG